MAVTLVAFEALAVATILPVVSRRLGDLSLYGWVFSAFLLSSLVGIVVAGTLADRRSVTLPMLAGLAFFASGLIIGGTASSMPVLVAGRAVQGIGAGVVPATAYVAISRGYPPNVRPQMFAVLSSAWVVPGLVGPAIAAAVASAVGWRWVFLGLVPLVVVAGLIAAHSLRTLPPAAAVAAAASSFTASSSGSGLSGDPVAEPAVADRNTDRAPVRWLPVAGIVAGAGIALAAVDSGRILTVVVGMVAGAALLAVSLRRLTPEGTLRARPGLPATVAGRGLLTFGFYAADAYVPYALTTGRHAPTWLAGLALTAGTILWTVGAWVQARYVQRLGPRRLVRTGQVLLLIAVGGMGLVLLPAVPPALGVLAWSVAGMGMGIGYAPLSVATLDRAPAGEEGRATSALQLTDVLGQAIGTGVAGGVVAAGVPALGVRGGVGLAFAISVAVGMTALLVGVRLPDRLRSAPSPAS